MHENDFSHGYGNYFESAFLKVTSYRLCSKFFRNIYGPHWQQHLKVTLQLKNLQKWIYMHANTFLGEYHETKIGCTKVWACFVKSISLIIVFFFFSQTNKSLSSTLCWSKNFHHNLSFSLLIFCISWSSSSDSTLFYKIQ